MSTIDTGNDASSRSENVTRFESALGQKNDSIENNSIELVTLSAKEALSQTSGTGSPAKKPVAVKASLLKAKQFAFSDMLKRVFRIEGVSLRSRVGNVFQTLVVTVKSFMTSLPDKLRARIQSYNQSYKVLTPAEFNDAKDRIISHLPSQQAMKISKNLGQHVEPLQLNQIVNLRGWKLTDLERLRAELEAAGMPSFRAEVAYASSLEEVDKTSLEGQLQQKINREEGKIRARFLFLGNIFPR